MESLRYALAKQVASIHGLVSDYGTIDLGNLPLAVQDEIRSAVGEILRKHLQEKTRNHQDKK